MGDMSFGQWVKRRRRTLALTQAMLSRYVGCTTVTIRKIEAGRLRPSQRLVDRLAEALHIPAQERTLFQRLGRADSSECLTHPPQSTTPPLARIRHLPVPLTPLVDREQDRAAVEQVMLRDDVRLLTLTGAPGVGKTRLALQVATDISTAFGDGVAFVALAPLHDVSLVITAIAQTLGVREAGNQPLLEVFMHYLHDKHVLLVLDNFEQVVAATPIVTSMLEHAPRLKVLITSRASLRVAGEHVYVVPPLTLPDLTRSPAYDQVQTYAAVALFVQRAQAVQQTFALTTTNAATVAEICIRLDGLPLAIELAAARINILPPQALLRRLTQRLQLLTEEAGWRTASPPSLRQAIAWSYDLLAADEQILFQRLGVFVAGGRMDAITVVCQDEPDALQVAVARPHQIHQHAQHVTLDKLAALVDKSMLYQVADPDDEPRFMMLETIREFALERLEAAGEAYALHQRHATYYLQLAEMAAPHLLGTEERVWLDRLAAENDNLRSALIWSQAHADQEELCLRLTAALSWFWLERGYWNEGQTWLMRTLAMSTADSLLRALVMARAGQFAQVRSDYDQAIFLSETSLRHARAVGRKDIMAIALRTLGWTAYFQSEYAQARQWAEESLQLSRESGHKEQGDALHCLAVLCQSQRDYEQARSLYEEELRIAREHGGRRNQAQALMGLGDVERARGDLNLARWLYTEGSIPARELNHKAILALLLSRLGEVARMQARYEQAKIYYQESFVLSQELGLKRSIAVAEANLGHVALQQGDPVCAAQHFWDSLQMRQELGLKPGMAECLSGIAGVALVLGHPKQAASLFATVNSLLTSIGAGLYPADQAEMDHYLAAARGQLDPATFDTVWQEGQAMPVVTALAAAHEIAQIARSTSATPAPGTLTPRETEILQLVATGLTNAQVAERLIISPRTVNAHLNSIYSKLGCSSRSAAIRFALEQGLV